MFQNWKKIFSNGENWPFYALAFFSLLLPFQFALNPAPGIDLAIARIFILLIFGLFLISNIKHKKFYSKNTLITKLILAFLVLAIFSLSYSHVLSWSFRKLLFLLSIVPIYFIAISVFKTKENHIKILKFLVSGSIILAAVSLIQFLSQFIFGIDTVYVFLAKNITPFFLGNSFSQAVLSYPSWLVSSLDTNYMRAVGPFPDPHMLSYYFGLLIPWSVMITATSEKRSLWFLIGTFFLIFADIATFTRGGYIALIAASVVVLPLVTKQTAKKIVAGIILFFILFLLVPHNPVASRLTSSFDAQEGSNAARLSNWQQAFVIIKENPFGTGIGMYSLAVDPQADYRTPIYAHNLYLDIAAELGIPAAIIFILLLILIFISFWKAAKKNHFYIAGVASITVFSIHSLVETPLYSVHVLPVFFIVTALAATIKNYEDSNV